MPLYRGLKQGSSTTTPPPLDPTRRVNRADSKLPRPGASRVATPAAAAPVAATDAPINLVVGWLAIIAGPGRGTVLPLSYGVNDIGRGVGAKVRLDFGDTTVALENQAAIIYTAGSRHFYLQSVAAETRLNGQPAPESVALTSGDLLQLGQTRLRFVPLCGPEFDWRNND